MQNKERPPRVYSDKKGSYIINGDRKMRITPLNSNKNMNNNQNVVNVILKECRTKQKRRKMSKPKPKQPIPMKPLEQQANDANYRLYHIIQDRKREAEQQLRDLIQKVQEKSIGIPSTDNSLIAMAREMKTSPSELKAEVMPSVSQQILSGPDEEQKGQPPQGAQVSEEHRAHDAGAQQEVPQEEIQGEVPAPIPQQEMQLIQPTDIEVNQAGVPIVAGEMALPELSRIEELKQEIQAPLETNTTRINKYFSNTSTGRLTNKDLSNLAIKYNYQPEEEEGKQSIDKIRDSHIKFLKNNDQFLTDFIQQYATSYAKTGKSTTAFLDTTRSLLSNIRGNGKGSLMTGLYDDQINDMLRHEPKYFGCISRDEIHKLQLDDNGKYGFVYNTVPSNKPTIYEGHWRAIYIDLDENKSIDHYDSFGEPAEEDIQNQIGTLLKPFNLPYYLKWKDNKIVNQRSNSSNCGFFCVNFLQDRFEGIPFVDSTGYSNANKAEKDLKKKFGYLV